MTLTTWAGSSGTGQYGSFRFSFVTKFPVVWAVRVRCVWPMDEGTFKDKSLNVAFTGHYRLGWWSNFVGSESGQCKTPEEYDLQHNSTSPPTAIVCIYWTSTFSLGRGVGQRGGRGATEHYCSIVPSRPWGQQFTSWVENTNHEWMYLQSKKSVKHNAAMSVNRSILKKSRHIGIGVF